MVLFQYLKKLKPGEIQTTLMLVVSGISLVTMLLMGIIMYMRFSTLSRQETIENSRKLMEQTGETMEDYLVNMRHIKKLQCSEVIMENGLTLPVSGKNYSEIKRAYLLWKGAQTWNT